MSFNPTAEQIAEHDRRNRASAFAPRTCEGCGCDDEHACTDPVTGGPCAWIIKSADGWRALCSVCARVLVTVSAETRSDFQNLDVRASVVLALEVFEAPPPMIALATEGDIDLAIRDIRRAAGL